MSVLILELRESIGNFDQFERRLYNKIFTFHRAADRQIKLEYDDSISSLSSGYITRIASTLRVVSLVVDDVIQVSEIGELPGSSLGDRQEVVRLLRHFLCDFQTGCFLRAHQDQCSLCYSILDETGGEKIRQPCPYCQSIDRIIYVQLEDSLGGIHDMLGYKVKESGKGKHTFSEMIRKKYEQKEIDFILSEAQVPFGSEALLDVVNSQPSFFYGKLVSSQV